MMKNKFRTKMIKIALLLCLKMSVFASQINLVEKIEKGCPKWMQDQINQDLKPYRKEGICKAELYERYLEIPEDLYLAKIEIKNNKVSFEIKSRVEGVAYRLKGFLKAFKDLCHLIGLDDTIFYITIHDGLGQPELLSPCYINFPVFVMSRGAVPGYQYKSILIPDYEGLYERYQVLKHEDITRFRVKWSKKSPVLVWRGSTVQSPYSFKLFAQGNDRISPFLCSSFMNKENAQYFSRYILCEMSLEYPELIDGKYTFLADLEKTFPKVLRLQGEWLSYEEQLNYKYHILLNGNAAPYSNSGWKFFTNSVVFIPEEQFMTQWYFSALKPYIHYLPVKTNLEDLVDKIQWARSHDKECKQIAENARLFALNNLTRNDYLVYFYFLLKEYNQLLFD